jgi:LuxR family transcriptional regulator, maltose regulon positive regulatory protein
MGTGVQAPLLQAQLRPPPVRPGVVARPKLIDRLTSSPETRVVTIVAPAGFGKSTLLSLWRQQETRPVGWLSLDRYHNDPAVLHGAIVAAFQQAGMVGELPAGDLRVPSDLVTVYGVARVADALARRAWPEC